MLFGVSRFRKFINYFPGNQFSSAALRYVEIII
jgi:hypothetical protein